MSDDRAPDRDGVLRFPEGGAALDPALESELRGRFASLYAATPSRGAGEAARVASAVLADVAAGARREDEARSAWPRRRWWWGAAAAALLVAVTMRPWRPGAVARDADSAAVAARVAVELAAPRGSVSAPAGGGVVRFDLRLPGGARDVALVGDFNGWDNDATPMLRRSADGTWSAQVTLPPGRHIYAFVVDGVRWLIDPLAPQIPDAGFGPANALVVVGSR